MLDLLRLAVLQAQVRLCFARVPGLLGHGGEVARAEHQLAVAIYAYHLAVEGGPL